MDNKMPIKQISLRISGTKQRQVGFVPLVALGVLAGDEGENMDRTTIVAEKPVYIIKHARDYVLYEAIDRKVKPFDRDTPGVLSIAVTIPRAYRLADGRSPFSLLKEVYDKFVGDCMASVNDGYDSFLDKNVDREAFRAIIDRYPLEERKSGYVPMNPAPDGLTGTLCVPREKMEDLFRDSQYEEFAKFRYIEIGSSCPTSFELEALEIPRPVRYEIFVNGARTRAFLSRPTDTYTVSLPDDGTYTYDRIAFSLQGLLEAPEHRMTKGETTVELDRSACRIVCKLGRREIEKPVVERRGERDSEKRFGRQREKREALPVQQTDSEMQRLREKLNTCEENLEIAKNEGESYRKKLNKQRQGRPVWLLIVCLAGLLIGAVATKMIGGGQPGVSEEDFGRKIDSLESVTKDQEGCISGLKNDTMRLGDSLRSLNKELTKIKENQSNVQKATQAKAAENAMKAKARAEIFELINKKALNGCREHSGWKTALSEDERYAVEAVLANYDGEIKRFSQNKYQNVGVLKKRVKAYLETVGEIRSYQHLLEIRQGIVNIECDYKIK